MDELDRLIEQARDPEHFMHGLLLWDDAQAAQFWRRLQVQIHAAHPARMVAESKPQKRSPTPPLHMGQAGDQKERYKTWEMVNWLNAQTPKVENTTAVVSILRHIWSAMNQGRPGIHAPVEDLRELFYEHPEVQRSATAAARYKQGFKPYPSVVGYCHWMFAQVDEKDADEFFVMLRQAKVTDQPMNVIEHLRNKLHAQGLSGAQMMKLTKEAWVSWKTSKNFLEGRVHAAVMPKWPALSSDDGA